MNKNPHSQKKGGTLKKPPFMLSVFRFFFRYGGALFPTLVGRFALKLWYKTNRIPILQREVAWLSKAKIEAIEIQCETLHHQRLAVMTYFWQNPNKSAPLIMLVHGWTGRGSQMGAFAEPLLSTGFSVLAFDNHAHAQTAGTETDIFTQSEVQQKLADIFGPVYGIVAHSFGGMVTPFSLNNGMQAQKVVCVSPPARFYYLMERFSDTLYLPKKVQHYMIATIKQEYGDNLSEHVSATVTSQQLGHIPALIIHDEDDYDVPLSEGELLHQAWPNSKFIRTQGLGHRRILYDAGVIKAVVDFLKL